MVQWPNSPSCCWTAMKSKKLTCLEFRKAICLAGNFQRFTLNAWLLQACHKRLRRKAFHVSHSCQLLNRVAAKRRNRGNMLSILSSNLIFGPSIRNQHQISTNHWCSTDQYVAIAVQRLNIWYHLIFPNLVVLYVHRAIEHGLSTHCA